MNNFLITILHQRSPNLTPMFVYFRNRNNHFFGYLSQRLFDIGIGESSKIRILPGTSYSVLGQTHVIDFLFDTQYKIIQTYMHHSNITNVKIRFLYGYIFYLFPHNLSATHFLSINYKIARSRWALSTLQQFSSAKSEHKLVLTIQCMRSYNGSTLSTE